MRDRRARQRWATKRVPLRVGLCMAIGVSQTVVTAHAIGSRLRKLSAMVLYGDPDEGVPGVSDLAADTVSDALRVAREEESLPAFAQ
jgi:hypothetical protein